MKDNSNKFSSNLGFILVSIGGAVGMGNLWRFPYFVGKYGGAVFLGLYLCILGLFGIPLVLTEIAIGRRAQCDATHCFPTIYEQEYGRKSTLWKILGFLPLITPLAICGYYNVVGGWAIQYFVKCLTEPLNTLNLDAFHQVTASTGPHFFYAMVCIVAANVILLGGVKGGIEKADKIILPILFTLLVVTAIRAVTLPGAGAGLEFLFKPNWHNVEAAGGIGPVALKALSASFASLSIGYGSYMTFGYYLSRKESMLRGAFIIPITDTMAAMLAALTVMPMVFASGQEPGSGAGMLFGSLPLAFASMGTVGKIFATAFFLAATFAAITSVISLMEVGVCWLEETYQISRFKSLLILDVFLVTVAVFCVLGYGPLSDVEFQGKNFFDFYSGYADLLLPVSALVISVFLGWVWKPQKALLEITNNGELEFKIARVWAFLVKYVCPVFILIVFIMNFI